MEIKGASLIKWYASYSLNEEYSEFGSRPHMLNVFCSTCIQYIYWNCDIALPVFSQVFRFRSEVSKHYSSRTPVCQVYVTTS